MVPSEMRAASYVSQAPATDGTCPRIASTSDPEILKAMILLHGEQRQAQTSIEATCT